MNLIVSISRLVMVSCYSEHKYFKRDYFLGISLLEEGMESLTAPLYLSMYLAG